MRKFLFKPSSFTFLRRCMFLCGAHLPISKLRSSLSMRLVKKKNTSFGKKAISTICIASTLGFLGLGLMGCSKGRYDTDLQEYVAEVLARPEKPVAMIPNLKNDNMFTYAKQDARSPFKPYSLNAGLMPEFNRPKEELEAYPIDGLHMVGVLNKQSKNWAIVRASDDSVHYISIGGHLGQNFGKVTNISKNAIKILELMPNGTGGFERHETTLNLEVPLDEQPA